MRPPPFADDTSSATATVAIASTTLIGSVPMAFPLSLKAARYTCEMAAGPMPTIAILYVSKAWVLAERPNWWTAVPTASCTANPTQSKSQKEMRPPSAPALEMPIAVAICVDVGPGIAWPRDMSSMKRCSSSHLRSSTNVFKKRAMCAWGPPNATKPMGANAHMTSRRRWR